MEAIYQSLDMAIRAKRQADMANDLEFKAESHALIGKIYYMFLKNLKRASECYGEFRRERSVDERATWFMEARELD